jgi:hypothetical protein
VADSGWAHVVWRKSTASGANGDCVEVAFTNDSVYLRNSRTTSDSLLTFSHSEWAAFLTGVYRGEFDLPQSPI